MKVVRKTQIILNGGLGNQLFGLAAALSVSDNITIIGKISNATMFSDKRPEVMRLTSNLGTNYIEPADFISSLLSKLHNYFLVGKLNVRSHWALKFFPIAYWAIRLFVRYVYPRNTDFFVASDLGYVEFPSKRNLILVGYFQSYRWTESKRVLDILQSQFAEQEKRIAKYVKRAQTDKPIILHIRLGDYKKEDSFGILTESYYSLALDEIMRIYPDSPIWVFSDEPGAAKNKIHKRFHKKCIWASEIFHLNALETLTLMRFGYGYVIANSSFSWWAATLAINPNAKIYCPSPWFKNASNPSDLIPSNWESIRR